MSKAFNGFIQGSFGVKPLPPPQKHANQKKKWAWKELSFEHKNAASFGYKLHKVRKLSRKYWTWKLELTKDENRRIWWISSQDNLSSSKTRKKSALVSFDDKLLHSLQRYGIKRNEGHERVVFREKKVPNFGYKLQQLRNFWKNIGNLLISSKTLQITVFFLRSLDQVFSSLFFSF